MPNNTGTGGVLDTAASTLHFSPSTFNLELQFISGMMETDAFQIHYKNMGGYAFPLIGGCPQKVWVEQSTVILIAPFWPNHIPTKPIMVPIAIATDSGVPSAPSIDQQSIDGYPGSTTTLITLGQVETSCM